MAILLATALCASGTTEEADMRSEVPTAGGKPALFMNREKKSLVLACRYGAGETTFREWPTGAWNPHRPDTFGLMHLAGERQ